ATVRALSWHRSYMTPQLVDIGINLTHDSFDSDRAEVIARAQAAGVSHFLVTGADLQSTRRAIELVDQHPTLLRATAGVHPHHAAGLTEDLLPDLEALLGAPQVSAAGECGLDYFRDFSPR